MKLWTIDEDGVRRFLGVPVGIPLDNEAEVVLRGFEPENPKLWVPRTVGAGWELNIGAVAVKLGLLRPDDSLPDLEAHFPAATKQFLRVSPWLGAALSASTALLIKDLPQAASKWSLTARPQRYVRGSALAAITAGVAVGTPVLMRLVPRSGNANHAIDAVTSAQAVGVQTMVCLANIATYREAHNPGSHQPLLGVGILAAPVITGGILVTAVKSALKEVNRELGSE